LKHFVRSTCAVLLGALISSSPAWAQASSVTGRVVDPQGAIVANAEITLTAPAQSARSVRSAQDGTFGFGPIAPGSYTIRTDAAGFSPSSQTVTVGASPVTLTITLPVAGVSEDVTVRGALMGTVATGKTTLPVRDLPLTIQTVSGEVIAEQGANDLITALKNVPGVNAFTTYGVYEYYTFRGFFDSALLLDGVRNDGDRVNRTNTQLTNIDRIEVLKGPSSALYGSGALGATVNLIRKKPTATPTYDLAGSVGSWKTGRVTFGSAGRLGSDAALYRFDIGSETKEGYRHNDTTRLNVTPSLQWRFGDNNQLNVYYTFNRDRFGGDAGLPLTNFDFDVPVEDNVLPVPRDRNYRTPQDDATSYDHNIQVAYARQLSDSLGFRNTLSYRHFDDEYLLSEEVGFSPPSTVDRSYLYFKHHGRPLMNIAELTGRVKKGIEQNLVFGWETQRYRAHSTRPAESFFAAESIDAFNPVETQGPTALVIDRSSVLTNTTNAVYVQDHLTLGPRVKLLLGGRYDIYRNETHLDTIDDGVVVTPGPLVKRDAEAFSGRAGLVYQPSRRVDLYGSFANSFKPYNINQPDGSTLDPLTGTQIEFGQRFHIAADRVQLNTAVYRILKQNVAFGRPGGLFAQAGEVESRGFEADLETALTSSWRINGGYAFTDAQLLDYEESVGVNLRGNTPVFAPRHTFNLWTGYDWRNGFGVNVGGRYIGTVFADNANVFEVDGYGLANVAVRYRRGALEYALNINNITDTKYFVPHLDYAQVYPGDPSNVLGTVRVRWR
jgi:iron complex outermembrane receptor protein